MEKTENDVFIKTLKMRVLTFLMLVLSFYKGICQDKNTLLLTSPANLKKNEILIIKGKDTALVINPNPSNDSKLTYIEKMPQPLFDLETYLTNSTEYSVSQFSGKNKERVYVQFLVNSDGSITNIKLITHLNPTLDSVAKHIISTMPKWKPGIQNGKAVNVHYTLSLFFKNPSKS